jgi:molybdenum cofactor cytidylyltransferase
MRENQMENTGLILLAAGASARLGRPKQLLIYHGQTLLQHSLQAAMESGASPVVVVLGAHADLIKREIKNREIHIVENLNWQDGMASSIQRGIEAIENINADIEGIILMVCDQPFVTSSVLGELIAARKKTGKSIIACRYEGTFGPPAFFHKSLFKEMLLLKGDKGARSILGEHLDAVELIPFPGGGYDIDTESDLERIQPRKTDDNRQI